MSWTGCEQQRVASPRGVACIIVRIAIAKVKKVVEKIENCYLALGVVHSLYTPMQDRFKDFIANPKSNGYQSVHTTVFGPNVNMIEIQIRTKEMEETAEIGIAAHWVYKNGKSSTRNHCHEVREKPANDRLPGGATEMQ